MADGSMYFGVLFYMLPRLVGTRGMLERAARPVVLLGGERHVRASGSSAFSPATARGREQREFYLLD